MSVPQTSKVWTIAGTKNGFDELKFDQSAQIPPLGERDVLVKIQGASLNFRDLIIPQGKYPFPMSSGVVPGSDGAGTVVAVGKNVKRFKQGDNVLTLFNQKHLGGALDQVGLESGLGGAVDGTLRQYGAFDEDGLVQMPSNLNFVEASTLCCAGLTAWNALYGSAGHELKAGDWVLTEGTGGVSIFGVQFAKAAGAKVVATTGDDKKAEILKKLGADHIINYKTTPQWGSVAKDLTPGKRGFNHVIEVAGPVSMKQSISAIGVDGVITIIGFVGGGAKDQKEPSFMDCLTHQCVVRGIVVGSRVQLEDMCRAVQANDSLKPIIDKTFPLEDAKKAYEYQWSQGHVGKVCIDIQ